VSGCPCLLKVTVRSLWLRKYIPDPLVRFLCLVLVSAVRSEVYLQPRLERCCQQP